MRTIDAGDLRSGLRKAKMTVLLRTALNWTISTVELLFTVLTNILCIHTGFSFSINDEAILEWWITSYRIQHFVLALNFL